MKLTSLVLQSLVAVSVICINLCAGPVQLVSAPDPTLTPSAAAAADSAAPMMTPDGRFVLFSSTAVNLTTNSNGAPLSPYFPAKLNVFLRDRTAGTTTLISGNQSLSNAGNGDSLPSEISTNGQFIAFESSASDLVPNDTNNVADIFLRDAVSNTTTLISVAADGSAANGGSRSATMTPDGRYIAFVSVASNLVAGDLNGIPDIFLRDTWSNTTALVSVGATATSTVAPLTNTCESPEITPDGRYVAFYSTATNLVPGITNKGEIYLRDTVAGTTDCASVHAHSAVAVQFNGVNNVSFDHAVSADGQFVAYEATAVSRTYPVGIVLRYGPYAGTNIAIIDTNAFVPIAPYEEIRTLDMTPDGRFITYVFNVTGYQFVSGVLPTSGIKVWDAQTGLSTLVSANINGTPSTNYICDAPSIDPTGRFVTFISNAPDLVTNNVPAGFHCYMRDLQSNTTTLIDVNTHGAASLLFPSSFPRTSADCRYVAFSAFDSQLVDNDINRSYDVFVRDLVGGNVELISAREASLPAPSIAAGFNSLSLWSVSANGRFVVFSSLAENLVTNDFNTDRDVFVRDLLNGITLLVSVSSNGVSANNISSEPSISDDGRYVAFSSYATDIVAAANRYQNIFVADLQSGTTTLTSQTGTGTQGNGNSYSPLISSDGRYVLFRGKATNLATNSTTANVDSLYFRDMQSSNVYALTTASLVGAAMTHNGQFVVYSGNFSGTVGLWLWTSTTASRTILVPGFSSASLAITEDGSSIAYVTNGTLHLLSNGIDTPVGPASPLPRYAPRFGGGLVVFGNGSDLMTYDLSQQTTTLVTHAFDSAASAGGVSDFPDISANGRYIAYRSTSSNLVQNMQFPDTNGTPRLFVYDTQTGTNNILSTGASATSGGNFRSFAPIFAADGRTVVFSSYATDLVNNHFNQATEVFEFAFLYADVTVSADSAIISWPAAPGQTYHVQYKDNVDDAGWQILNGTINITGNRASITDSSPLSDHRIYRVATF